MRTPRYGVLRGLTATLAVVGGAGCSGEDESGAEAWAGLPANSGVTPVVFEQNPSCEDVLGPGYFELKLDPPNAGTYNINGQTVTITTDGESFDWESTIGMDAVLAKGGRDGNAYLYDPEEVSDGGLHSPINPKNETPYGLSHITFCFDYDLEVTKTAETSFSRQYVWDIDKWGSERELPLSVGHTYLRRESVRPSVIDTIDSDFEVHGTISIHNPTPIAATITSVRDELDGAISIPVDCDVTFPYELDAGDTLLCTYSQHLSDAMAQENEAVVETSGAVGGGSDTVHILWGDTTRSP